MSMHNVNNILTKYMHQLPIRPIVHN